MRSLPRTYQRAVSVAVLLWFFLSGCQSSTPTLPVIPPTAQLDSSTATPTILATPTQSLPTATPTPASRLGVSPEQIRGKRVHFWFSGSQKVIDAINAQILEFNGTNPYGIWVDAIAMGSEGEISDRIQTVLGSPNQPDLVLTSLVSALNWGKADLFVDPSPYLDDPVYGMAEDEQENIPPGFWQEGETANRRIALPGYRNATLLFYNKTWGEELGFQNPPATPDEFKQQACDAAQVDMKNNTAADNGLGGWIVNTDPMVAVSWLSAFGGNPWADSQGKYDFNSPQSAGAFTFLRDLLDQGCAWVARDPQPYGYFARRQALFYSGSMEDLSAQEKAMVDADSQDQWTVLGYPAVDRQSIIYATGPDYLILASTPPEQLAAWIFENWMVSSKIQSDLSQKTEYLPMKVLDADVLGTYTNDHPQWAMADSFLPEMHPVPPNVSWVVARPIVGDAFSQVFSATTQSGDIPVILTQLNQTITELQDKAP